MVIVELTNGLGNQLFQYAMGRSLSARRQVPLALDLSSFSTTTKLPGLEMYTRRFRLDAFQINARIASGEEVAKYAFRRLRRFDPRRARGPWRRFLIRHAPSHCAGRLIPELNPNFQPRLLNLPGDVYLKGFWQSEGYFKDFASLIREELTLKNSAVVERAVAEVSTFRKGQRPLVAVQVRRGDVARAHEVLKDMTYMPYQLTSAEYLRAAMAEFGENATFVVFSESAEDIAWCRTNLSARDIHFSTGHDDLEDFAAMSRCDHNIISNSSFGWWAAWLNPNPAKIVVAPRQWFRPQYAPRHDIRSLVPSAWILK